MAHNQDAYDALKRFGFSPAKALEIMLDVQRGSGYALRILHIARSAAIKTTAIKTDLII